MDEQTLIDRSRALLAVAIAEREDEPLRDACIARCNELQNRAMELQLARKQAVLSSLGIPLTV
ncbi:MAG: hypothetical protein MN733_20575 [Nitrososphaera sp.]|nr:hypothetical protein [Nitrososphaera sp.]